MGESADNYVERAEGTIDSVTGHIANGITITVITITDLCTHLQDFARHRDNVTRRKFSFLEVLEVNIRVR
jgi:hypothetical protein